MYAGWTISGGGTAVEKARVPMRYRATPAAVKAAADREEREMSVPGLTTVKSSHGARETMDRLMSAVTSKGLTVFARIDHGAGAAAAGLELWPTEVLIFGNANGGTPL